MTSSTTEHKRSRRRRGDVFRPPTKHLRRGKACLNCRFLKIKCDGVKPTCGQCIRVPKDDPCEYTDGPSRTVQLQQNIVQLQARIRELEQANSNSPQPSITTDCLSQYLSSTSTSSSSGDSSSSRIHSPIPPPLYHSPSSVVDPFEVLPQTQSTFRSSLDLEVMNDIMLPEVFLPHAAQFGFFLNADRFRTTIHSRPSYNFDIPSPSPWKALLSAVNLWGIHLSETQIGTTSTREADLLQRALSHAAMQISSGLQNFQTIQLIQAKVLLAAYFLRKNQVMDSDYHISGAVSLCLSLGLHKFSNCSAPTRSGTPCGVMGEDRVEIEERIRGFWTVFALQRHILILHYPSSCAFGYLNSCQEITTPWPVKMSDSTPLESLGTLRDFWPKADLGSSYCAGNSTELDRYVKATILLQKAVYYLTKIENNSETDFNSLYHYCVDLNDHISRFKHTLPPLASMLQKYCDISSDTESHKPHSIPVLVTTHAITSSAQLKVQQTIAALCEVGISEGTGRTGVAVPCMIDLALDILQSHYSLGISGCGPFDPVSSILCGTAYEFILREQARVESQSVGLYWLERDLPGLPLPDQSPIPREEKSRILVVVEESKSIMNYLSTACPCINYQFERVTKLYGHIPKSIGP